MKIPVPIFTLSIMAMALAGQLIPGLAAALIYDRGAILDGEWWRLLSGHLVHFSSRHFLADVLALGLLGACVESRCDYGMGLRYVCLALVIGLGLLALEPDLGYFGGLSGIVYGLGAWLALDGISRPGHSRGFWAVVLLALCCKLAVELYFRKMIPYPQQRPFAPVPLSHLLGVLVAIVLKSASTCCRRNSSSGSRSNPSQTGKREPCCHYRLVHSGRCLRVPAQEDLLGVGALAAVACGGMAPSGTAGFPGVE